MRTNSYLLSALVALALTLAACSAPTYEARQPIAATDGPGSSALVVVRIPIPWYAPRFVVRGKFRDALPEYEPLAPLDEKYFTISDDGRYGGIYVWKSRADAESHFDTAWRAGIRSRRGVDADVLVLDAPYRIEGRAVPHGKQIGERSIEYPAWASLVSWALPEGADETLSAKTVASSLQSLQPPQPSDALIRAFVVTARHSVGIVAIWVTREAAESAVGAGARDAIGKTLVATGSSFTLFEAPLLLDASLR